MEQVFLALQDVFRCFQTGTTQDKSTCEVASLLCSSMGLLRHNAHGGSSSKKDRSSDQLSTQINFQDEAGDQEKQKEMMCFALSMMESISSKLASRQLDDENSRYYEEVLRASLEEMCLMSNVVCLFGFHDKLVSHFAAKCAASVVLFQFFHSNSFDRVWLEACVQIFQKKSPGNRMVCTLWSLTNVIKGILASTFGNKNGAMERLLLPFNEALPALYPEVVVWAERGPATPAWGNDVYDLQTNLSSFVDLLEVLTAARFKLSVCCSCQRLLFQQALMPLLLAGSRIHYHVLKKLLLLLKTTLLGKAGEDLVVREVNQLQGRDVHLDGDMHALAEAVLQAVLLGWLQHSVPVDDKASFFGGTCAQSSDEGPDLVMMRAASLILLKSMENKIDRDKKAGLGHLTDLQSYLCSLMLFLKRHLSQKQLHHPCSWVSIVFGEQDDDLIEAAKVLLTLCLHQRRLGSGSYSDACDVGCNPHCHFISLLRSVAFDYSVLLDFLISPETCFLEYLVLFLKLLRDSWEEFARACKLSQALRGTSDGDSSLLTSEAAVPGGTEGNLSAKPEPSFHPLVDYESSGESESEESPYKYSPVQAGDLHEHPEEQILEVTVGRGAGADVVACLKKLREVIAKLHSKNLYPYNPTPLLKLLMQIEAKGIQPK